MNLRIRLGRPGSGKPLQFYRCFLMTPLLLTLLLGGCFGPARAPIPRLDYRNPSVADRNTNLMILLRGIWGGPEVFAEQGIVEDIFQQRLPFDLVAPDAHFGYYRNETLSRRLQEDIILPAKQQGYEQIWLVGVSMGGLGALIHAGESPAQIDGILLINPFLGWGDVAEEISAAGGLENWQAGEFSSSDWERYLWHGIQQLVVGKKKSLSIYLGSGEGDYFRAEQEVLAAALPPERSLSLPGGHDYATMKMLWLSLRKHVWPAHRGETRTPPGE